MLSKYKPPAPRLPLGQIGLNLVSGEFAGDGLLSNIAGSAKGPYSEWTKADDATQNLDYQTRMAAAKMGISKDEAERLARIKAQKKSAFAAQTREAQVSDLSKQLSDINSGNPAFIRKNANTIANQMVNFQTKHPNLSFRFKQPQFVEQDGKKGFDPNTIPIGTYFYDVITNTFKLKKADEIVIINPDTLEEME
jgi:ATPase subunit of ABC transporter with duplicated ATPase domains